MEYFNLFLIPLISLGMIVKRENYSTKMSFELVMMYAEVAVANAIMVFCLMHLLKAIIGIYAFPDSQTYSVVALFMAIIIPLARAIIKKNIEIKVEMTPKD